MYVYVIHVRDNGRSAPIGVFSNWDIAESEADNHAASVYKISRLHNESEIGDGQRIRIYAVRQMPLIHYLITRFILDEEPKRPEPGTGLTG